MPFATKRFGPFQGGVTDAANPLLLDGQPALRSARNAVVDGMGRLIARFGTATALTLMDDQGTPAPISSVCCITPFADGALAAGWSSVTQKAYLYWLKDDLTNWYNASKVLQNTAAPLPVAVLWSSVTTLPVITIAEGLNIAYIAHYLPVVGSAFETRQFDTTVSPAVLSDFQANLRGSGLENTYFRGVVSFKQHLWAWGFGSLNVGDGFRPELIRFSTPFFAPMAQADNFAVGNRTRSVRESIVAAVVAGEALYIGTNFSVWPVTGFGRNSWDKSRPADDSYGFAGPRAAVVGPNGVLYYWSHRGLLRIQGYGPPQPLWPRISQMTRGVVNDSLISLAYDLATDQVLVFYQDQASGAVSRLCAYDTVRDVFLGPDGDVGLGVGCAGLVTPGLLNTPAGLPGPAGPPVNPTVSGVGNTVATLGWDDGDLAPDCVAQVEYQLNGASSWTIVSPPSGLSPTKLGNSFQLTGLTKNTNYNWRVKDIRNGISSTYLTSTLLTANQLAPPTFCNLALTKLSGGQWQIQVTWGNSGEMGVQTEVWFGDAGGPYTKLTTAPVGDSSYNTTQILAVPQAFQAEVRHVQGSVTPSTFVVSGPVGTF